MAEVDAEGIIIGIAIILSLLLLLSMMSLVLIYKFKNDWLNRKLSSHMDSLFKYCCNHGAPNLIEQPPQTPGEDPTCTHRNKYNFLLILKIFVLL